MSTLHTFNATLLLPQSLLQTFTTAMGRCRRKQNQNHRYQKSPRLIDCGWKEDVLTVSPVNRQYRGSSRFVECMERFFSWISCTKHAIKVYGYTDKDTSGQKVNHIDYFMDMMGLLMMLSSMVMINIHCC
ncbi:unnamed protein product [Lactuca virosa]|uniref:Uncharacterized protein n=1 Tax=Lactuca virosa TaxID=75947 RepID=A0AAU9NDP5_9ASTR|nr:unnamed protein product [Lactuca virosa]